MLFSIETAKFLTFFNWKIFVCVRDSQFRLWSRVRWLCRCQQQHDRLAEYFCVMVDVSSGRLWRNERHIVKRRHQNTAIQRKQVHETIEFRVDSGSLLQWKQHPNVSFKKKQRQKID